MTASSVMRRSRPARNLSSPHSALAYGVLWGIGVAGMETVVQPVDAMTSQYVSFVVSIGFEHVFEGVCIAWAAMVLEQRLRLRWLPVVAVLMAVGVGAAITAGTRSFYPLIGLTVFPSEQDVAGAFWYHTWMTLTYGGLLLAGRTLALRAERVDRLLARAELERSRSEVVLGELQLQSLQGGLKPELLRDVLAEIQRRQKVNRASAERLLDELVGFLRLLMQSLRLRASTLAAELALAQAYVALRVEHRGRPAAFHFATVDGIGDIAFPPLLLLPLIDAFAFDQASPCGHLAIRRKPGSLRITLSGAARKREGGGSLNTLIDLLEVGLRASHHDRAAVRHEIAGDALEVLIHLPRQVARQTRPDTYQETHDASEHG